MTQGRDGISLAPEGALRLMGVARRLSFVAAMFVIAALVAGTAGTSYAKSKKSVHHKHSTTTLLDTVTVTNYGAAFGGSLATFSAGEGKDDRPSLFVKGANTLLGSGTGPAGVSVSSLDAHIAVAYQSISSILPVSGFPSALADRFRPTALQACAGCAAGNGFRRDFSPGANRNAPPESIIGTRNVTFDNTAGCAVPGDPLPCCTGRDAGTCQFNTSGVDTAQGVAYEDPFDGVNPGRDILAIRNTLPISFFSTAIFLMVHGGGAACAAFAMAFTVGTIAEFDVRKTLSPASTTSSRLSTTVRCVPFLRSRFHQTLMSRPQLPNRQCHQRHHRRMPHVPVGPGRSRV